MYVYILTFFLSLGSLSQGGFNVPDCPHHYAALLLLSYYDTCMQCVSNPSTLTLTVTIRIVDMLLLFCFFSVNLVFSNNFYQGCTFFAKHVVSVWNSLPNSIVFTSATVQSFRSRLAAYV